MEAGAGGEGGLLLEGVVVEGEGKLLLRLKRAVAASNTSSCIFLLLPFWSTLSGSGLTLTLLLLLLLLLWVITGLVTIRSMGLMGLIGSKPLMSIGKEETTGLGTAGEAEAEEEGEEEKSSSYLLEDLADRSIGMLLLLLLDISVMGLDRTKVTLDRDRKGDGTELVEEEATELEEEEGWLKIDLETIER